MKKLLTIIVVVFMSYVSYGQKASTEYVSEYCSSKDLPKKFVSKVSSDRYVLNDQSTAALVEEGKQYEIPFTIKQEKDYKINLFLTDIVLEDSLQFEIMTKDGISLYKNIDMLSSYEFSVKNSCELILRVDTPGKNINRKIADAIYTKETQTGCLIVVIQYQPTLQTGF